MTLIFRYVECEANSGIEIKEFYFGYLQVHNTTGEDLLTSLLSKIEFWNMNIEDGNIMIMGQT